MSPGKSVHRGLILVFLMFIEILWAGLDFSIYVKLSLIMEISTQWLSELEMKELAAGFMNYDLDQDSFSAEINVENMMFIEKTGMTQPPERNLPSYQEKISSIEKSYATPVPLTAATQTLSNTFTISFGNINLEDEFLQFDDSGGNEAVPTTNVLTKATRKQMQAKDHVLAERKRRDKLNNQFNYLSSLLPNLKNVENMTFIEKSGKTQQPEIKLPSYQEKISSIDKSSATLVPLTAATQTLSNTFTISFGNINLEDEVLKFDDSVGYEAARTISVPTKAARKQMQAKDHVLAERKRRDKLNNQFSSLSALLPNLKKIDKSSVLEDATNYIKELQGHVKELEEASQNFKRKDVQVSVISKKRSRLGTSIDDKYYPFNGTTNNIVETSAPCNTYPEIDVRISGSSVIVSIQCQKNIYYLVKVLNQMQKLGLSIISSMSAMPFAKTTHLITIVAQIEEDLSMEAAELVKSLRQAIYLTFDSDMH
ncbi:transcription factor bHLH18-like protein [Tanacetum coccineum]